MTPARRVVRASRQLARLRAELPFRIPIRGPAATSFHVTPGTSYRVSARIRPGRTPAVVFTEIPA